MSRHPISGWRNYTFSEIAKKEKFAIVDGPFGTQLHSDEYTENGVPVVRIENLSFSGKFKPDNLVFISEKKAEQLKRSRVVPGDLIIAKTGATIGKSGMFPDAFNSGIIASSCMKVSCDTNIVDPKLILYMIVWEEGQKKILEGAGGSTRTSINIGPFSNIQLYLPESKSEQRKIAEILTAVDDAIEQTEALIHKYQRIKQGLMQDLLLMGIDDNGQVRDPIRHPWQFTKSELGWIPSQWTIETLGQVTDSAVDGPFGSNLKTEHYSADGGVRVVRLQNIGEGYFDDSDKAFISVAHANSLSKHQVQFGDLLIASMGDDNHPIARACIYPEYLSTGIVKADCFRFRLNPLKALNSFVMWDMCCESTREDLYKLGQGVTRDRINLGNVKSIRLRLPPIDEQKQIVKILESQAEIILLEMEHLLKLEQMKKGLMQDLLTGKVRTV